MVRKYNLKFMEEKFYKTEIKLKDKELIILTPIKELKNLFVCTENLDYFTIFGDMKSYMRLACIFAVMYEEKNVIIYLPLRDHGLTGYLKAHEGENSAKDIVIMNHRIQFNVKDWKCVRRLLNKKNIAAFQISEDIFPKIDEDYKEFYYKTNKDVLDVKNTFQTIFFVGSSKVYGSIANDCKEFAEEDQEPFFKEYKYYHNHRHLDMYLRKRKEINFSIDYYDKELWES